MTTREPTPGIRTLMGVVALLAAGCGSGTTAISSRPSHRSTLDWDRTYGIHDDVPARFEEDPVDDELGPEPPTPDVEPEGPWDVPRGVRPREWLYIVIHHSATDEGSAAAFRRFHRRKGWNDLAYHFVIGNGKGAPDGMIEIGGRWKNQQVGAHAGNKEYNYHGIGICLVGNFAVRRPTAKQMKSLCELVTFLAKRFDIGDDDIVKHSDVNTTKCPGRLMPWPIKSASHTP